MTNEQLNNLVIAYKLTRSGDTFRTIYDAYEPIWKRRVNSDAKRVCTDRSTMLALYDDALMAAIERWDSTLGDFANYLNRWINRARSNVQRTSLRRMKRERALIEREDAEGETPISELDRIASDRDYILEDHVIERMYKKKKAQQIELLDFLLEPVKVQNDSTMIAVIEGLPRYKNRLALAKALGIHHEIVNRKLRKLRSLSARFDANRFGELEDYIAI